MRELTEEELKLAPDWTYMYSITSNNNVRFHSDLMFCIFNGHVISDIVISEPENFGARLLNKKPFDITKHEWSDFSWSINQQDRDAIELYNHETCTDDGDAELFQINKSDSIAIAKHFGLTEKDLK